MLPSLYEETKHKLKLKIEKTVTSICITVDFWSTFTNESMLAVTGHYIEEDDFTLKYCLLDCVPLEESHTGRKIAKSIKDICDEWQVSNKVLLGVFDNDKNVKNAI